MKRTQLASFYAGCRPEIERGSLTKPEGRATARRYVEEHHPRALCGFLFGSIIRDSFASYSDLDVVIIQPEPTLTGMRRHIFDGCPLEVHIFDRKTVIRDLQGAARSGRVNVALGLADSEVIFDTTGVGAELKMLAQSVVEQGPPPMSEAVARQAYTAILKWIVELTRENQPDERFATIAAIQPFMMNFHFAARQQWVKGRKWAVLEAPQFAARLNGALMRAHTRGDVHDLLAILEEIATPFLPIRWEGSDATVGAL